MSRRSCEPIMRSPHGSRVIPNRQRLAAVAVLGEREAHVSAVHLCRAITVRPGGPRRDLDHGNGFGVEDGMEGSAERGVLVADREAEVLVWSPRSAKRVRAAGVVHAAVGCAVTPSRWTRRVWTSLTNRT